ncbi:MAG: hypothetical protein RLZZ301_1341 [Bacteroidota bacterium]|jgi:hypothetical protein
MRSFSFKTISLSILLTSIFACTEKGCTNPYASNYSLSAKKNDGSCIYSPGIKLIGDSILHLPVGSNFIDEGAIAIDSDGSKPEVSVINTVNTAKKGTYTVQYKAQLNAGEVSVNRKVEVAFERANWLGTWKTTNNICSTFFPDSTVSFVVGDQDGLIQTTDLFDQYSPNAKIVANIFQQQISIPQQYIQVSNMFLSKFSAVGEMNDAGTIIKLTFTYKNQVSNSAFGIPGTCVLKYTKVE